MSRKIKAFAIVMTLAAGVAPAPAVAWEPASTHAGMTERSALHGHQLHRYLKRVHGLPLGVFEPVRLDLDRVGYLHREALREAFGALDPIKGYQPDAKGYNRALSWLTAGSVVEEVPFSRGRHHFFNPRTGRGLHNTKGRWGLSFRLRVLDSLDGGGSFGGIWTGANFNLSGKSALAWARYRYNDLSLTQHLAHRRKALTHADPAVRRHHLAMALLSAGALLHLMQDMAVPAHVRNDFARTYLARRSNVEVDRASAFETLVRKRYGRAGIPKVSGSVPRYPRFDDYFKNKAGTGLAQLTQKRHYSLGSLPRPVQLSRSMTSAELGAVLRKALRIPGPAIRGLRLREAGGAGLYYGDANNPYLFAYRVTRRGKLEFTLDRRCYKAAATRLVPHAVRYSAGLLAHLLRGEVILKRSGQTLVARHSGVHLGAGRAQVLWDDKQGVRRSLVTVTTPPARDRAGLKLRLPAVPPAARQLVYLWQGKDAQGEPLVLGARLVLPKTR